MRDGALGAIRGTLTDWFTATPGKTKQVFYYDRNWGTLIGYPASYGSDEELNDHHFRYGYWFDVDGSTFPASWKTHRGWDGLG